MLKRIVISTDLRYLNTLPAYVPPPAEYEEYRWKKYGRLRVLRVHAKKSGKPSPGRVCQTCDVLCECGRIVTLPWYKVKNHLVHTCGNPECIYTQMELEDEEPAIVERCAPQYECPSPSPACLISSMYHVCCCECDRPCKQCENSPEKCGAKKRKVE